MVVKLYLPDDWTEPMKDCWLGWLKARIEDRDVFGPCKADNLLNRVEGIEMEGRGLIQMRAP